MFIEVIHNTKVITRYPLENIPTGNSYDDYKTRKLIIAYEASRLRKVYPYYELWVVAESKMNGKKRKPEKRIKTITH